MTFEEFFIKKKIDLEQLKQAEPGLFSEFKSHFELMGEKSFDHTKKFWFNKLRRAYHIKEVPKPEKEIIVKTKIASQAEPLSSPTIDQKPLEEPLLDATTFSEEAKIQTEVIDTSLRPKFTPRNIIAKPKQTPEGEDTAEEVTKEEATKAVGFKPRFKPKTAEEKEDTQNTKQAEASEESKPDKSLEETKPAYKPKFNLKNIPKKAESEPETKEASQEKLTEENKEAAEAKETYKPKFNLRNIPKVEPQSSLQEEEKSAESKEITDVKSELPPPEESDTKENLSKEQVKPAYKPRFNMKNIKPKTDN